MGYGRLADLVVLAHALFVAFVVLGGLLVLRWPRVAWVHIPCALWGMLVEFTGWICPLTPLEDTLRRRAAEAAYSGDFLQHYLLRALYPDGLTRGTQVALGSFVLVLNVAVYAALIARRRAGRHTS